MTRSWVCSTRSTISENLAFTLANGRVSDMTNIVVMCERRAAERCLKSDAAGSSNIDDEGDGPMQVFLSYSRRDSTFVRRLAESLEGRDVDAWLDTDELAATDEDRWRRSIVQGIRESAALVVVLSPDSVSSGQVERELTIAAETKRRIIPIIFRPCDLPDGFQFELAGVQRIDFSEQPYESALDQLVRRIGVLPPPENVTPVLPLAPPFETAARA